MKTLSQTNQSLIAFSKDFLYAEKSSTFILTRFNLNLYSKNKVNDDVRTEEWLCDRFSLFDKYCFPSVTGQSESDFIWLCCFDDKTPQKFLHRIGKYKEKCRQFLPLFFNETETVNHTSVLLGLIKVLKDNTRYLTTIRLDNDDALNRDFVCQVNSFREKQKQKNVIYSFPSGLQYFENYGIATKIIYPENHFLALINIDYCEEDVNETVLSFRHDIIEKFPYPFVLLNHYPAMWVEVIHSANVANDIKRNLCNGLVLDNRTLRTDFLINVMGGVKIPYKL